MSSHEEFSMEDSMDIFSQLRRWQTELLGAPLEQNEKEEEFERLVAALRMPDTEEERLVYEGRKRVLWDMVFGEKEVKELGENGDANGDEDEHNSTDDEVDALVQEDLSPSPTESKGKESDSPSPFQHFSKDSASFHINVTDDELTLPNDIDNRAPYRLGWPLLPILPMITTYENVPKILSPTSEHLTQFRAILQPHKIPVEKLLVVHRANPGVQMSKSTLTLCVLMTPATSYTFGKTQLVNDDPNALRALAALRAYITSHILTLRIEIIDARAFSGFYTLPIVATETLLTAFIKKKKHGIMQVLRECGEEVRSVDFYYRGLGKTRAECRPTVVVTVPEPNKRIWWEVVLPKLRVRVGGRMDVELVFGERVGL